MVKEYLDLAMCNLAVIELNSDLKFMAIILIISVLLIYGFAMVYGIKYSKLNGFVRDNKLQKKFQEWKKDNRGLI